MLSGQLRGKSEIIPPGGTQTLITMETEAQYAEMLTVQVDASIPPQPGPGVFNRAFITVTWGVSGARHTAIIDVGRGTSFTVVANFLIVEITNPSFGAFTSSVAVAASVVVGSTVRGDLKPRFTAQTFAATAVGADFIVPIPKYAQTFRVMRAPTESMRILQSDVITIYAEHLVAAGLDMEDSLPIANGASLIRVINTGAAPITAIQIVFDLTI
jgi:hypothetical protein